MRVLIQGQGTLHSTSAGQHLEEDGHRVCGRRLAPGPAAAADV
jgi:hypothetical protein